MKIEMIDMTDVKPGDVIITHHEDSARNLVVALVLWVDQASDDEPEVITVQHVDPVTFNSIAGMQENLRTGLFVENEIVKVTLSYGEGSTRR